VEEHEVFHVFTANSGRISEIQKFVWAAVVPGAAIEGHRRGGEVTSIDRRGGAK
jgi:hypothetical protein